MTNYYQVKMTKCDGRLDDYTVEDVRNILLSSNPYIGVNEWYNPNDSSCDDFKNIQPSDIVLVANGQIGVAIVEVIPDDDSKQKNKDGFVNRKKVKVIKLLNEKESELPAKSRQSRTVIKSGMNIEYMKNLLNNSKENVSLTANMKKIINDSKDLLDKKKQIILYGSAGTGKTYNTKNIIEEHSGEKYEDLKKSGRVEFVTFHQSFAYEDFIEGIKPNLDNKDISYSIEDGVFKNISFESEDNYEKYQLSKKNNKIFNQVINYENLLDDFGLYVKDEILRTGKFKLDENRALVNVNIAENGKCKNFTVGGSVTSNQKLTRDIIIRDIPNILKADVTHEPV